MSETSDLGQAISRGIDSISLSDGSRLRQEAERSYQRSADRTERGWTAVGDRLREQIARYQ